MHKLKAWIRDYFGFSKSETNGFIVLSVLMVLLLSAPLIFKIFSAQFYAGKESDQRMLDSLVSKLEANYILETQKEDLLPEISPFNPNALSSEEWMKLGIKPFLAERIVNYVSKGGKFKKKSDLKKIYGFVEEDYNRLETYILLPDAIDSKAFSDAYKKKTYSRDRYPKYEEAKPKEKEIVSFNLNLADTTQLMAIRGIGPKLSMRIIQFRTNLGGFVDEQQLKEVYGLEESVIEELLKYAFLDDNGIQRINVNSASVEQLSRHPYIDFKVAKSIVAYREQHGAFVNLEGLSKLHLINQELLGKITPYLAVE